MSRGSLVLRLTLRSCRTVTRSSISISSRSDRERSGKSNEMEMMWKGSIVTHLVSFTVTVSFYLKIDPVSFSSIPRIIVASCLPTLVSLPPAFVTPLTTLTSFLNLRYERPEGTSWETNKGSDKTRVGRNCKKRGFKLSLPWSPVIPLLLSHEIDGVRKEKERLTAYQLHYKSLGYSILHLIFHMNFHSLEFIIYNLNLISIS